VKAKPVKKLDPAAPLVENAARILQVRLDEMRSFAPAALQPDRAIEQHDLRIAAKRLRYVLEATEFCFGRPATTARRRARDIQEVLGELHDCDVMLPRVAAHVEELRGADARAVRARAGDAEDLDPALVAKAPSRTAYRGLGVLAVHVQARRALLFDRFVDLWGELERAGTWERLERAIGRKLHEARERRAAAERAERAARELEAAEREERAAAERARRAADVLAEARRAQGGPTEPG
jgi:CHAD domain